VRRDVPVHCSRLKKNGRSLCSESARQCSRLGKPGQIILVQDQVAVRFEPEPLGECLHPECRRRRGAAADPKRLGIGVLGPQGYALIDILPGPLFLLVLGEGRRVVCQCDEDSFLCIPNGPSSDSASRERVKLSWSR